MGKVLFVVRHAEAQSTEAGKRDIDRLLSSQGLQDSTRLGAYILQKNADVGAIVSSSATRAMQTAEQIADQINFDVGKIIEDEDLYEASVRIILNKVESFSDDWNEVILVGHNPVLSYFVEYLTGHHFDGMKAGSMVKISTGVDTWEAVSQDVASFEYYVSPDDYAV